MTTLRVLIVEGHHGVRDALERRLRRLPGIQVVAAAADLDTAFALISEHAPDVILCDPRSVDGIPLEVVHRLCSSGTVVVVLTTSVLGGDAGDFLSAGAAAVLLKGCSVAAIQATLVGAYQRRIATTLVSSTGSNAHHARALKRIRAS